MIDESHILELNQAGLLSEVVGYETTEVAKLAAGSRLSTLSSHNFIDFTGGIAVHACGHNHPEVVEAIREQAQLVLHTSDIMRHAPQLELADFLATLLKQVDPSEPWQTLFMNSGSESIDSAAKLALKATGRHKFIAFEGAFHGRTLFASALSRSKTPHWNAYEEFLGPLRANIIHLPPPRCKTCAIKKRERCCLDTLESILENQGSEIAAVFFEAQQGEGGYVPLEKEMAVKLRALTQKYGILLIADEIQAGFGRTGKWFGFQHLGIVPDMIVFGKAVGGGLPLAGVSAPKSLMEKWQPGEHGTTFGGNPVACASGLAALKIIAREDLVSRTATLGERIKLQLSQLIGMNGVSDVRGNGLMLGIELRDVNGNPDFQGIESVKLKCREAGLLLLTCGAKIGKNEVDCAVIRMIPPLNIPEETLNEGIEILKSALLESRT